MNAHIVSVVFYLVLNAGPVGSQESSVHPAKQTKDPTPTSNNRHSFLPVILLALVRGR